MKISRYLASTAAGLLVGGLAACGGGGGGGGGSSSGGGVVVTVSSEPLQYTGNSSAAAITASNASAITATVLGDNNGAVGTSNLVGGSQPQASKSYVDISRGLIRTVRTTVVRPTGDARLASAPVDQTYPCEFGGTVRISGDITPLGTGTLNIVYSSCSTGNDITSGTATMVVDNYNFDNSIPVWYTITFTRLAIRGLLTNIDIAGSVRVETALVGNSEKVTENMVTLDVVTGRMTKSESLVFVDAYDNVRLPNSYVETVSGRLYQSIHGYVDINTTTPLVFPTMTQVSPSGGELMLTGAANARIRATASVTVISLGIDLDADGVFEMQARLNWDDLGGPAGADLADTDGDGMHNSWETAFGLNPNVNDAAGDLDGDGFTNLNEYQVGARPNAWNQTLPLPPGTTKLPTGPASGLVTALANNSDIVYDSVSKRIYAAVRTNPGSVVPIDPTTGALGTPIPVGGDPVKLAISDDGQFLYIGLDAQSEIQRIRLATQAVDLTIALGSDPLWGPFYADDIEVLPGSPQSIAVSLRRKTATPRHQGVVIYDGNVPRPTRITGSIGSTVLQFSASAATLYGYDNESTPGAFRRMSVDANGVVITDVYDITTNKQVITNTMSTTDMIFAGGYLFFSNGQMIDPVAPAQLPNPAGTTGPTFTMPNPFGFVTADAALNRAFYLVTDGGWSIRAYNISTRLQIGSAPVPTVSGRVGSLIRWGARGLAFRTSDGQIFMVHSGVWIP